MGITESTRSKLENLLGERFTESPAIRLEHGSDMTHFEPMPPDAVAYPETVEDVQEIVKICCENRIHIVPYGVGTSLEGNIHAVRGGVCIDTSRMNAILAVHQDDMDVVVQPGVTRGQLNSHLRDTGLFFPVDPGADASIGGMASTRASGTNAVRYGTMMNNVLGLQVVTPSGEVIRTAKRARKSSAGYDLTRLFVGSEGTLGIITEVNLRVHGVPETILSATCTFGSVAEAIRSVIEVIQIGVPVARIEFLDPQTIRAVNHTASLGLSEKPMLLLEFHGTELCVEEQVTIAADIFGSHGATNFWKASSTEERNRLWAARHNAAHSIPAFATGTRQWWTDVCVPISRLADCIELTVLDIEKTGLFAPMLGHVGDGNFHLCICAKEGDDQAGAAAEGLHRRLVERALSMEGTCTGEHGIGRGKIEFLELELGEAVPLMRSIKQALDPHNIMNPGKIFA